MAVFLTTKSIQSNIEQIIKDAHKKIVVVSPFIKLSDYYMDNLTYAAKRGVVIKIVYGKSDLHPTVLGNIESLDNVEIYYFEHLHAKCYLNESSMIITSMNFYDASERNREMGVFVKRSTDKELFDNALNEIQLILDSPQTIKKNKAKTNKKGDTISTLANSANNVNTSGYCIRCKKNIFFNPDAPYCKSCYSDWKIDEIPILQEKYCHSCGYFKRTSKEKPQCYDCYQINAIDNLINDM